MLQKFCKRLWIAPTQANPNIMSILRSFDAMAEENEIICDVADVYATYSIHKITGDSIRVNLQCHFDQTQLFLNPTTCDKVWKEQSSFCSDIGARRNTEIFRSIGFSS